MKKSYTPDGLSLPELKEVVNRIQDKEPELETIIDREDADQEPQEAEDG